MKRSLNYPPEVVASLSDEQLTEMLQLDLEVLLCYTPAALRAIGAADRNLVGEIGKILLCFARSTADGFANGTPLFDDKQLWEREGFESPLTDREFLRRMAVLASWCADYCESDLVEGEIGYAAWQNTTRTRAAEYATKFDSIGQVRRAGYVETDELRPANAKMTPTRIDAAKPAAEQVRTEEAMKPEPAPEPFQSKGLVTAKAAAEDWELDEFEEDLLDEADTRQERAVEEVAGEDVERDLYMPAVRAGHMHLPNVICGSAILRTGARSKRRQRWHEPAPLVIRKVSGYKEGEVVISYSGEELRPGDLEVWSKLLTLAAAKPLGSDVHVHARELLQSLSRGTGGNSYAAARDEIGRLQAGIIHIRSTCPEFIKQLSELFPNDPSVRNAQRTGFVEIKTQLLGASSTDGTSWTVEVPRKVRAMFGPKLSSWFDESVYYSLKTDTARRLFLLYSSHVACWPLKLAELHDYLGSSMSAGNKFRDAMDAAHDELKAAKVLKSWRYESSSRRLDSVCYVVERAGGKKERTVSHRQVEAALH